MAVHTTDNSPRAQLIRQLKPSLPKSWRLIKFEDNLDEIDRITVMVRIQSVSRMPEAPQGFYLTTAVLELLTPQTDLSLAEDSLDVALFDLLDILNTIKPNLWVSTQKVLDAGTKRLAYDVTIHHVTTKD